MSEWIPIKYPPTDSVPVLISLSPTDINTNADPFVVIDRIIEEPYEDCWTHFMAIDEEMWEVTAWMPLPKPYGGTDAE